MGDRQHLQWWFEGVDAWNSRRTAHDFRPDLARECLVPEDLAQQNLERDPDDWEWHSLTGANLAGANLTQADLRFANLKDADLREAILEQALLNHAVLTGAKLQGAVAVEADLTGAKMLAARLDDAWLNDAVLDEANLTAATLKGSRLDGASTVGTALELADLSKVASLPPELLKADLYLAGLSPAQHPIRFDSIADVGELLAVLKELKACYRDFDEEVALYFRGEPQLSWDLRPSVVRNENLKHSEGKMLVQLLSRRPEDFGGVSSALGQWVLAQHHGLATRFLDITSNPLVALFHASEADKDIDGRLHVFAVPESMVKPFNSDIVSVIANIAKLSSSEQEKLFPRPGVGYTSGLDRLYQLIRTEKPYFEERIDPKDFYRVFIVEPQQSSERIRAQSGAFLVSAFHQRFERDELLKWNSGIPAYGHYRLQVPAEHKEGILEELRSLNISREKLFPGLDASAEAIGPQVRASVALKQQTESAGDSLRE